VSAPPELLGTLTEPIKLLLHIEKQSNFIRVIEQDPFNHFGYCSGRPAAVSDKSIEWVDQFGAALGSDLG
jgi:hypothetical protein